MRTLRLAFTITASVLFGIVVFVTAVVMMMAISTSVRSSSTLSAPQVGEAAPHFTLPDLEGRDVDLAGFRGKPLVIVFWADWCPDCKHLVEELNLLQAGGTPVLAINLMESKDRVVASKLKQGMKYPVLLDRNGDAARLYGVQAIPKVFVLDESGLIAEQGYSVPAGF